MMSASPLGPSVSARLRVIEGHLRAVDRLVLECRTREAIAQLLAVRGALGVVASQTCRQHLLGCLRSGSSEADDVLAVFRAAAAQRIGRRPQPRRVA